MEHLRSLLEMLREAQARSDERAKVVHERFNVFTTLLWEHDEVRLHTRFIHCLLDPEGCHDCGPKFLNLFFLTLRELHVFDKEKRVQFEIPHSDEPWMVRNEVSCAGVGRIDLLLERSGFGIVIENKIFAREQEDQIAKYADYLSRRYRANGLVIYLTRHGAKSDTHNGRHYIRISYADHILSWLEKCLRETYDIIPINQVLLQYRAVVRGLTGRNAQSFPMDKISEFITKHPDIIHFRNQINAGIEEARASFLDRLADGITKNLEQRHGFKVHLRNEERFGTAEYGDLIITPPLNSVLHDAPFRIWVQKDTPENVLAVGIALDAEELEKERANAALQKLFERMHGLLKLNAVDRKYVEKKTDAWPTGWLNLIDRMDDDDRLAALIRTSIEETIHRICGDILDYIKLLEETYEKARLEAATPTS